VKGYALHFADNVDHPSMSSQLGVHLHSYNVSNSTFNISQGHQINFAQDQRQLVIFTFPDTPLIRQNAVEDRRQCIRQWLNAPDTFSNHKTACSKRQPGTGDWFVRGDVFSEWKANPGYLLWLHGNGMPDRFHHRAGPDCSSQRDVARQSSGKRSAFII